MKNLPVAAAWPWVGRAGSMEWPVPERRFTHSVCRWCFSQYTLEDLCAIARDIGIPAIDLLDPQEWDVALRAGLSVSLSNGSSLGIRHGFNDPGNHAQLQEDLLAIIPQAADKGVRQVIVFSGNRNGRSDADGLEQCAVGLAPVMAEAERRGVRLVMELLNSKVDHKDYQCDRTSWGVELVRKIDSPYFRLLYDIYHMQIMEGDVIRTIRDNAEYIAHYHTAGVPGRHEIDDSQELFYPAIMRAIAETGFSGYVAQEFVPAGKDPVRALRDSIRICSV